MGRPFSSYFELQLVSQSKALSTLTMASTRSSQSASPGPKGTKRAADASSSPPAAKRGRGRPKKAQDTSKNMSGSPDESANGNDIEEDEAVAKQTQNGNDANGDEKESKTNANSGEKNAFDEVKADTDDVKKAANKEQEEKSKEIMNNNKSVVEDDKREAAIPSSI